MEQLSNKEKILVEITLKQCHFSNLLDLFTFDLVNYSSNIYPSPSYVVLIICYRKINN